MLDRDTRLRPNDADVASEVMDGEAIMINLADGTYYSTAGVGAVIWDLISDRHTLGEITELIGARYDVPSEQARADVERLAAELLEERVVLISDEAAARTTEAWTGPRGEYKTPRLKVYRDMADLLALDPPMPSLADVPWKGPSDTPSRD